MENIFQNSERYDSHNECNEEEHCIIDVPLHYEHDREEECHTSQDEGIAHLSDDEHQVGKKRGTCMHHYTLDHSVERSKIGPRDKTLNDDHQHKARDHVDQEEDNIFRPIWNHSKFKRSTSRNFAQLNSLPNLLSPHCVVETLLSNEFVMRA